MTPEQWERAKSLFSDAVGRPPGERAAFLAAACGDDAQLRSEVESLLAASEGAAGFLSRLAHPGGDFSDAHEDVVGRLTAALAGRYAVERELGRGGMAVVYLARDLRHRRAVALKVLAPHLSETLGARRFLREVETAARLSHPHLVPLFDSGEAAGLLWYTMPFIDGESLRERIGREGPLPIADAVRLLREVAEALAYAHEQGVVHRDLKPENVLLSRGHALVADFGIAKAVAAATNGGGALTSLGYALGTPAYMAPEQALADPAADHRVDLYALGVVAYELLAGAHPFGIRTPQRFVGAHLSETPAPLTEERPDLPPALAELVARLLAKDPADRPQSAEEVVEALDRLSSPAGDAGTGQARGRTRKPLWWTGVGAALFLALASGAYWRSRGDTRRPASGDARAADAAVQDKSVAVLPLAVSAGDTANAYFADGLTDALIHALTRVPDLRVTPRTSVFALKGKPGLDLPQIGALLGVGAVLEGSVRRAGTSLRVSVALSDVAGRRAVWAERYDTDLRSARDLFALQDSIARSVAGALRLRLAPGGSGTLVREATASLDAYELYLRGRYLQSTAMTSESLLASLEFFRRALQVDPAFALAYAGTADTYINLADAYWAPGDAYPKAEAAALKALALDSTLGDTRTTLGTIKALWRWDLAGAEREYRRALALNPRSGRAHGFYAFTLLGMSRLREAVAQAESGRALDPLSAEMSTYELITLIYAGDYERTLAAARRRLEIEPADEAARVALGYAYASTGMRREALAAFSPGPCRFGYGCAWEALAYARLGERAEAERRLRDLLERARREYVPPDAIAWVHAALGQPDAAFERLEEAYRARSSSLLVLKVAPEYAPLRGDPRFAALVRRVGLP